MFLLAALISGCGFSVDTGGAGDDGPGTDPGDDDPIMPVARACSQVTDPALRLCIDFDDGTTAATDGSSYQNQVESQNLTPMTRDAEQAVQVDRTSKLYVPETPALDIEDELTVSLWVKIAPGDLPRPTEKRWLFDNNAQYFAYLHDGAALRCGSQNVNVETLALADGTWHHIACTYEPETMRVYIDGNVANCRGTGEREIPTNGNDGFAIGADLSKTAGGPAFADALVGGIDNVQVFARELAPEELCAAAGRTTCLATCPADI